MEETNLAKHSWQLPVSLVIGSSGPERALVMLGEKQRLRGRCHHMGDGHLVLCGGYAY
ncbi:hypothetical protein CgS9114_09953 [Corynebacterium glutamicum S9114]|nr:hypothetical protein CgS9114_09953 [Corynebacterium glutamicum S9114]